VTIAVGHSWHFCELHQVNCTRRSRTNPNFTADYVH
jgi:hypothetical protein